MTIDDKFPELIKPINHYTYDEVVHLTLEQISNAIADVENLKKSVALFEDWIKPDDIPQFKRTAVPNNFYDTFQSSNLSLLAQYSNHLNIAQNELLNHNNLQKNSDILP